MLPRALLLGVLLVYALLSAACSPKEAVRRMTPPEDDKLARQFLSEVRAGQYTMASKRLSAKISPADATKGLKELRDVLNEGEERSIEVIGVNWMAFASTKNGASKTTNLSYQIEHSKGWLAGTVVIAHEAGVASITSARFNRIPASLEELNRFTFANKGAGHYAIFAAAIAVVVFIIWTLVVCARSTIRRKWLWVIFILLGIGTVKLNWSTGETRVQPISVQLLGASGSAAGPYAPWTIGVSLPLGAIVFLLRRKRLVESAANPLPQPPSEIEPPTPPPVVG